MKAIVLCDVGAQDACAKEILREGLSVEKVAQGHLICKGTQQQLVTLAWHGQTLLDIGVIAAQGVSLEDVKQSTWPKEVQEILEKTSTFAVRSYNQERAEESPTLGATLKPLIQKEVNLTSPDALFIYVNDILAISLAGKDLYKRNYRIFTSNTSLRSTVAAAALVYCGYTGKEELLLPYENDGTLAIEAAFFHTKQSPHRYETLALQKFWEGKPAKAETTKGSISVMTQSVQFLKAIQKNAKIAGVHKDMTITKAELDWLDTKFEEKSKDIILAAVPSSGKHRSALEANKIADELAYQCKPLLKTKGVLGILSLKPKEQEPIFKKHKFTKKEEQHICMGQQEVVLTIFTR